LLELAHVQQIIGDFDEAALCYPWRNPDPSVDRLYEDVMAIVKQAQRDNVSRRETFIRIWEVSSRACHHVIAALPAGLDRAAASRPAPSLSEPWYCCAEPTDEQFAPSV
jgi:hypothetical protein